MDYSSLVYFNYLLFVLRDWHLTVILLKLHNLMAITNHELPHILSHVNQTDKGAGIKTDILQTSVQTEIKVI